MSEVLWLAIAALVGTVIGFSVNELFGRGVRTLDRRRARSDPLVVHVEADPSIIWAGAPPWIGSAFLVPPDADLSSPPAPCPEWRRWAHERGGVDAGVTQVRLTLSAHADVTVVVDGLRARVNKRRAVPRWRTIICAVGGADISPRRAEIRLDGFDQPVVSWIREGGEPLRAPTFSLSASEAEMLHVWAYADAEWIEWTAELLVLVDGQRQIIEISDGGSPFVTAASSVESNGLMWSSGSESWEPVID